MKTLICVLACLLPLPALAAKLGDCDNASYKVIVRNGGHEREVLLSPSSGEIQEFGPVVSFQIEGQNPMVVKQPDEEYCIWSGRIKIQRVNTLNSSGGGTSLR